MLNKNLHLNFHCCAIHYFKNSNILYHILLDPKIHAPSIAKNYILLIYKNFWPPFLLVAYCSLNNETHAFSDYLFHFIHTEKVI